MKKVKKNDLEINKLSKVYINKKTKTIALKEVSFNVKRGAMLALLGPNGAGKSTLINILAGIVNKSSGSANINGYNIDNDFLLLYSRQKERICQVYFIFVGIFRGYFLYNIEWGNN